MQLQPRACAERPPRASQHPTPLFAAVRDGSAHECWPCLRPERPYSHPSIRSLLASFQTIPYTHYQLLEALPRACYPVMRADDRLLVVYSISTRCAHVQPADCWPCFGAAAAPAFHVGFGRCFIMMIKLLLVSRDDFPTTPSALPVPGFAFCSFSLLNVPVTQQSCFCLPRQTMAVQNCKTLVT